MKKRFVLIFVAALVLLTVFAAAWHLNTRTRTEEGALILRHDGKQIIVHADALPLTDVKGETANGKGEILAVNAQGIPLPDLLASAGIEGSTFVTVTASDEYSASLTCDEFERAFIIVSEENSFRLIVFGDPDSRRNVRNLTEVIAE